MLLVAVPLCSTAQTTRMTWVVTAICWAFVVLRYIHTLIVNNHTLFLVRCCSQVPHHLHFPSHTCASIAPSISASKSTHSHFVLSKSPTPHNTTNPFILTFAHLILILTFAHLFSSHVFCLGRFVSVSAGMRLSHLHAATRAVCSQRVPCHAANQALCTRPHIHGA